MAITNNITNNTQSSYVPVFVDPIPVADPVDLVWTVGPNAPTTLGVPGTIFPSILQDNVSPAVWYHEGNPLIDVDTLSFFGNGLISGTYTTRETISGQRNKGVNELRLSNTKSFATIATTTDTLFTTSTAHGLGDGNLVYVSGVTSIPQTTGYWKVDVISSTSFKLLGYTGGGSAVAQGQVQLAEYYWDEVYTTPLGSYTVLPYGDLITPFTFEFTNDDSNEMIIYIEDPNIVPQVGDSLVIQKRLTQSPVNSLTTDGVNNIVNNFDVETYTFKINTVTFTQFPQPNIFNVDYTEYVLTLDKSFAPQLADDQYNLVILNRTGIGVNKSLLTDTWQPKEVHRQQVLGDPYNYVGVLQPKGQKNYLYYEGSKFLGLSAMLDGIINNTLTPYVILDFEDEIKDRLSYVVGDVEVHLPNVMIDGEIVPSILSNTNASGNALTYFTETTGVNKYAPLYLKNASNTLKRYGYVFFDLRIIVLDDAELATAVGYASKRNYTLPKLLLTNSANTIAHSGPTTQLTIIGATNANPIVITTSSNHNLQDGDRITIVDVQGNTAANTPTDIYFFIKKLATGGNTQFELYQDSLLSIPVVGTGIYIPGTGGAYSAKLPYEYFLTYRLKGPHYKTLPYAETIPFNFQTSGVVNNTSGQIELELPFLTHLVDNATLTGFQADEWEVIIGKYVPKVDNIYEIGGTTDVTYLENESLTLFSGLAQSTSKLMTITKAQYTTDLGLFPYNIKTGDPIFNTLTPLPSTLFISEITWFTGNVVYREHAEQYRMTFEFNIAPDKWNGTTNPTFVAGDSFMTSKLISELGFFIDDSSSIDNKPYIYGKISPPIKKDNSSSLTIQVSIDF